MKSMVSFTLYIKFYQNGEQKINLYLSLLLPQTQFLVTFYVEIPGMMQPNFKNLIWYFLCNNSWNHIDVFFCDFAWTYDVTLHYIPCDIWHLTITTNFCSHLANIINLSYISFNDNSWNQDKS